MTAIKRMVKRTFLPRSGPHRLWRGLGRGVTLEIDFEHNTRIWLGLYEVELNRYLRRFLRPGVTTFDVGAQLGYDALAFARRTGARVATFECDPGSLAVLRHNLALNPALADRIDVVAAAVGHEDGQLRLDEFAYSARGFVPDFVKIDVDGGEVGVLSSARRLLGERRPALVVETHSLELENACRKLLAEHSYRPVVVGQRRLFPDHRDLELNRWLVCA